MNRNVLLGGAFLLTGLIGGFVGRNCGLEQQVETLCSKYAQKRKITMTLQVDDGQRITPLNVPALFSKYETFKAEEVSADYLRGKVGFEYEDDQTEYPHRDSDDLHSRLLKQGTSYRYSISDGIFSEVEEKFEIENYENSFLFGTSSITVEAIKGAITEVYIHDSTNNTSVTLTRDFAGKIEFNPSEIDEAGARNLFDMYSTLFYHFKQEHKIDERIAAYSPRLDITQKMPSAEK